jgi:hypothetical protein
VRHKSVRDYNLADVIMILEFGIDPKKVRDDLEEFIERSEAAMENSESNRHRRWWASHGGFGWPFWGAKE